MSRGNLIALSFGALLLSLAIAVYINLSRPILACSGDIDLGTHDFGTKVPFRVKVANKGRRPLRVEKIRTSCSCMITSAGEFSLQANEFKFIEGSVRLPTDEEDWSETLVFQTNDQAALVAKVRLTAKVEKSFSFSPESLIFAVPDKDEAIASDRAKTVELAFGPNYGDVRFEKAFYSSENLDCSVLSATPRKISCRITLAENTPMGEFDEEITFEIITNLGRVQKTLRVGGAVGKFIQVNPGFAMLKKATPAELQFNWAGGSYPNWVRAKLSAQEHVIELGTFQLESETLSIPVKDIPKELKSPARIILETDRSQLLNIPVYFVR